MKYYPSVLYEEFIQYVPSHLKKRFESYKSQIYPDQDFRSVIEEVSDKTLKGEVTTSALKEKRRALAIQISRKKDRLYKKTIYSCANYPNNDRKNLSFVLYKLYNQPQSWAISYGDKSFEEVRDEKLEATRQWVLDSNAFMIDYPFFDAQSVTKKKAAFEDDLMASIYNTIEYKMQFQIADFTSAYFEDFDKPLFTMARKRRLPEDTTVMTVPQSVDMDTVYQLNFKNSHILPIQNNDHDLTLPNVADQRIMMYIINVVSQYSNDFTSTLIPIRNIANVLYPKASKISHYHYESAKRHMELLVNFTANWYSKNGEWQGGVNFLDSAQIEEIKGELYFRIRVGQTVRENIIENRIQLFRTTDYLKLQLSISKLLFYHLLKERAEVSIVYYTSFDEKCLTRTFSYLDFYQAVNFETNNKRKNITLIKKALTEYINNNLIIRNFTASGDSFVIQFFPMTPSEYADFKGENGNKDK